VEIEAGNISEGESSGCAPAGFLDGRVRARGAGSGRRERLGRRCNRAWRGLTF